MIYWFSGTGTSLRVARILAGLTHDGLQNMAEGYRHDASPNNDSGTGPHDEVFGLVFPVYGWRPPQAVEEFFGQLPPYPTGKVPYVYAVLTCGDDIGRTDQVLRRLLQAKGWPLHAVHSVQQRNTYVCLPGFDVDSPDTEASKLRQGDRLIEERISQAVLHRLPSTPECITPGAFPGFKTYVLGWMFRKFLTSERRFKTTDPCTGCRKCARVCPLHNITPAPDGKPRWSRHCTHCLACYHACPQHAVAYGPFTRDKGQVRIIR